MKKFLHFLQLSTILFSLIFFNINLHAQLANWRGELPFTIYNISDSTITNYQLPITLNTQYFINLGLMQANGNDIRFGSDCTGSTLFSYWIEGNINTDSTKIWVKIPTLNPNDSARMFMFFGNPSAPAASTLSIFNGPWSSTDSVSVASTNTVSLCQRGFHFTANEKVLVTHFGKKIPNATQRYVTLFDFTSQGIINQIQVAAGTSGQYNYNILTQPLWLNSGQQYVIELFNGSGDMYYYGSSTQINPSFSLINMMYCNSCTQNTFPTTILTGLHYGIPDFLFYKIKTVSQPPALTNGAAADTNTPAIPSGFNGREGNQEALLIWNKNTEFDMDKYLVFQNTDNNPATATQIGYKSQPDTSFLVSGLTNGTTYYFWLKSQDLFCTPRISDFSSVVTITPIAVRKISEAIPKVFALHQNYPNPFNPVTKIKFDLPKGSVVKITVYDVTGRQVELIVNGYFQAGYQEATFNALNLASGVYFYKIEAGDFTAEKKMVVLK